MDERGSHTLTVEKAVVFEAAAAEECVEGVQALLALHRLGVWSVDVWGALGRQRSRKLLLRQLFVPATEMRRGEGRGGEAREEREGISKGGCAHV